MASVGVEHRVGVGDDRDKDVRDRLGSAQDVDAKRSVRDLAYARGAGAPVVGLSGSNKGHK